MTLELELDLGLEPPARTVAPFKTQLLKWVGNKQRFAHEIASYFPADIGTYYEPFLGSGAVLATLAPERAVASDVFEPLIGIWKMLHDDPDQLIAWYSERRAMCEELGKKEAFELIKASYNANPNPADFLFITRSCYGGVVRFRQADGYISTPCGAHTPISAESFEKRVREWHNRTAGASFHCSDFAAVMRQAGEGDVIYCDPPYTHTQAILYGAQEFSLERLFTEIAAAKERGAKVVLSIDGSKRSGDMILDIPIPVGLFERELMVNVGRSMLKRFQMEGKTLESHVVADRLLLTY